MTISQRNKDQRTKARIVYVTGPLSYSGALAFAATTKQFKPYLIYRRGSRYRRGKKVLYAKQYCVVRIVDGEEKGIKTEVVSINKLIELD